MQIVLNINSKNINIVLLSEATGTILQPLREKSLNSHFSYLFLQQWYSSWAILKLMITDEALKKLKVNVLSIKAWPVSAHKKLQYKNAKYMFELI